jgi:hypothetical protein
MSPSNPRIRRTLLRLPFALTLLSVLAVVGCSSQPSLEVHSLEFKKVYTHNFSHAWFRQLESGEYQVVLVENPKTGTHSDAARALRQVIEINVLWRPKSTRPIDAPLATNATVAWTVFSTDSTRPDRLEYTGAALVRIDVSGDKAEVSIRNAHLVPRSHTGDITDPVGNCALVGGFTAHRNGKAVEASLDTVRASAATTRAAAAATHAATTSPR